MYKFLIFIVLLFLNFSNSVNADETINIEIWNDRAVNKSDTVNIIAEIWGTCSNFSISTVSFMELNSKWDWVTMQSWWIWDLSYSFVADSSTQIKAEIKCPQWTGPLYFSEIKAEDIISITVSNKWWWISFTSKMKKDAQDLFYNTWSLEKINLELNYEKRKYSWDLKFYWNGLWWNWQINYILEYSTWANFSTKNIEPIKTQETYYNFIEKFLDSQSYIHFFRVKSEYDWIQSNYSNVIKYYSEDYLKIKSCKSIKLPDFRDILIF